MNRPLKSYLTAGAILLSIVVVCAVACMMAAIGIIKTQDAHGGRDHGWVHEELDLEEDEIPGLEELERAYSEEKNRLVGELAVLQAELARQLLEKSESDAEVVEGVRKIHDVHGRIQGLSIRHYFDLLAILPEAKQRRLRELAAESLAAPSR